MSIPQFPQAAPDPASSRRSIAAAVNADGRVELFGIGIDRVLYSRAQGTLGADTWGPWFALTSTVFAAVPIRNSDGRLEVFAIGRDEEVKNAWQPAPGAGPWAAFTELGSGRVRQIAALKNSDGRIEVFAIGFDGIVRNAHQPVAGAGPWSAWHNLEGRVTQIVGAESADG